ncbi:FHA domain containing protein [Rippkaea orientalis PCC 8801]|uniref:Ferredoxin--NADP reductase n=1 Tax=Rippkaea orientalis (strain PCC 8801 / RF-1) TaxID=41431 RepID=B7K6A1_RIPO1|nr:FAD-binding oxidoreductase [Rippkaea orientalis]ACK68154.1 FHA domain containing protein [Rippkaea orientalis PCC 8801]
MLKIKLFNSRQPIVSQEFELAENHLNNGGCTVGSSSTCQVILPSTKVKDIHGKFFLENDHYYFRDLTKVANYQFNDEAVKIDYPYALETDDIIRIGEFVLIVDGPPRKRNPKTRPRKSKTAKSETDKASSKRSAKGSMPSLKSLGRKNRRNQRTSTDSSIVSYDQPREISQNGSSNGSSSTSNGGVATDIPLPKSATSTLPLPTVKSAPLSALQVGPAPNGVKWWTKGDLTVRCIEIIEDTSDVKTFRFVGTTPTLFNYKPGQFVTLNLTIDGKPVKRSYSISSSPSRPHSLEITVKRVPSPPDVPDAPPGLVSNWLHDNVTVGSEIKLSGPSGKFTCVDRSETKLLFISAGSGITPMMSMSRWALDTGAPRDIIFFHSARSPQDLIYRRELEAMDAQHSNFHLAFSITRSSVGEPWWGFTGRLTDILVQAIAPDYKERLIFVCGPDGFMKGVKSLVESMGFPMENYHQESFGGAKKGASKSSSSQTNGASSSSAVADVDTAPATVEDSSNGSNNSTSHPYTVVFVKSEKQVTTEGKTPLLEIAEEQMVEVNSGCRSGVCGNCKVKKLAGTVRYDGEPDGLDESDEEKGYILTCIAHPAGRVVLDV